MNGGAVNGELDPQARAVLDRIAAEAAIAPEPAAPPSEADRVAAVRQAYRGMTEMAGPAEHVRRVHDLIVEGKNSAVPVRIYDPAEPDGPRPALLWFHGGSFISGDLDTHDRPLRALANRLGFPVIAGAWRLAPEHPYPAGLEDARAVLAWAVAGGDSLYLDRCRIAVGGDSAGGAIAAALTQAPRVDGPAIAFQVLVYPNTDLAGDGRKYPSWGENNGRVLNRAEMEKNFALYAGATDRSDPGLSPIRANSLAGLPSAYIATGGADPQRDEGEAYATRLAAAGVAVEHTRWPGMIHGFLQMGGVIDAGQQLIEEIATKTREALS